MSQIFVVTLLIGLDRSVPDIRGSKLANNQIKEGLIYSFTPLSRLRGERSEGAKPVGGEGDAEKNAVSPTISLSLALSRKRERGFTFRVTN